MQPAPAIPTQHHAVPPEGLALTWDPVPGAIRYAFIAGVAGAPVPPLSALISGQAPGFALLGIPAHFTGAALIGSAAGEERQFGLVAYMQDGSGVPVGNLQFVPARRAPRDRQYHPLMPPALQAAPPSGPLAQPPQGQPEQRPGPLAPLRGGDPREAAVRFGAPLPLPHATPGAGSVQAGQGGSAELPMQQFRIGRDGLSVTWDAVPGAMRYGLVIGVAGVQPPPLETIMRGGSNHFSVLGIPARFTGTTLMGPAQDEDRQFCLIAWRSDGSMTPVQNARLGTLRAAPRDRDYHALTSPALTPPSGAAMPPVSSAPSAYAAPPQATPERRQSAAEAFAAMMAARQAGQAIPPPPTPPVQQTPAAAAADPWDLLTAPSQPAEPVRWMPTPAAREPEPVQQPEPRVAEPAKAADPWDLLGPPSAELSEEEEEPAPTSTLSLPDPWDVLEEAAPAKSHAAKHGEPELPTWLPVEPAEPEPVEPEAPEIEEIPPKQIAPEPELAAPIEPIIDVPPATLPARAGTDLAKEGTDLLPSTVDASAPAPPSTIRTGVAEATGLGTPPEPIEPSLEPAKAEAERHEGEMVPVEVVQVVETPPVPLQPIPDREESAVRAPVLETEPAAASMPVLEVESAAEMEPQAHVPAGIPDRGTQVEERIARQDEAEVPAAMVEPAAPSIEPERPPEAALKEADPIRIHAEEIRPDAILPRAAAGDALPTAPLAGVVPAPGQGTEIEAAPTPAPVAAVQEQPSMVPMSAATLSDETGPVPYEPQPPASQAPPAEAAAEQRDHAAPLPAEAEPAAPEVAASAEPEVQEAHRAHVEDTVTASDRLTAPAYSARREADFGRSEEDHPEAAKGAASPEEEAPAPQAAAGPLEQQQIEPPMSLPARPLEPEPEGAEPALEEEQDAQPLAAVQPEAAVPTEATASTAVKSPTEATAPPEVVVPSPTALGPEAMPTERPASAQEKAEVAEAAHPSEQVPAVPAPSIEAQAPLAAERGEPVLTAGPDQAVPVASGAPTQEETPSPPVSVAPAPPDEPQALPVVQDREAAPPAPLEPAPETQEPVQRTDVEDARSAIEEPTIAAAAAVPIRQDAAQQMHAHEVGDGGGMPAAVERAEEGAALQAQPTPPPMQALDATVTSYDVWLVEEPSPPSPPEPPVTPVQQTAEPVKAAPPSTGTLPATLVALLEEAELYLLPQWADYAEVARLLDRVEQEAPNHVRVLELRERLRDAQQGGGTQDVTPLLQEAEECLARNDFWGAVDLYEQALAKQPENAEARSGVERARMLARWSAQWTGATGDAVRLQTLGEEYAAQAPDLAQQAYAAAFALRPTVAALHGLLVSLVRSNRAAAVVAAARDGVQTLRAAGHLAADDEQDRAIETLARCGEPGLPEPEAERMIAAFSRLLAGETE